MIALGGLFTITSFVSVSVRYSGGLLLTISQIHLRAASTEVYNITAKPAFLRRVWTYQKI